MMNSNKKNIVVLGAGFGGTYTTRALHKYIHKTKSHNLILINATNFFLFTPLLHEVATGNIFPENIVEPLRKVLHCKDASFIRAKAIKIRRRDKVIETDKCEIYYDKLVIALGSDTNFYGTKGAQEHAFDLKTLADAIRLKNHFIRVFEDCNTLKNTKKLEKRLHFVVVGGGPTGVELASEMADLFYETFSEYFTKDIMKYVKITLVQKNTQLLPQFSQMIREKSMKVLKKRGINILLNETVEEVGKDFAVLGTGEKIYTNTVIWTAGVKTSELAFDEEPERDERDKIKVAPDLKMKRDENIYVIGDMAHFVNPGEERPVPALAQVATKQGEFVAKHISDSLSGKPNTRMFKYKSSGNLLSLGEWVAAGEVGRFRFFGHFAWWLWRTVYLFKLISWQKKLQVMIDWTINLFTPRDISEIHEGESTLD